uniref:Uncharacterized protein n=1 Tax=Avena sativa TaxID=4498 RepID=A0ACD5VC31_AVESA
MQVEKTQLKNSKTPRRKMSPIVSRSPIINMIARRKAQSPAGTSKSPNLYARSPNLHARFPNQAGTSKSPNLHDLSPSPTHGSPTNSHDLSHAANNGSKRRPRKLTSIIWKDAEPIYIDGLLMQGRCNYCSTVFLASKVSGTSQLARHLKVCEVKCSMDGVIQKIRTSDEIDPDWKFDQQAARVELVKLIVLHGLPFSFVEYAGFRNFCAALNPWFKSVSTVTVQNDCIEAYHTYRNAYESFFMNCNHRVSLTGDMWTSNQKLGYLCITCHWIGSNWRIRHRIIRFCLVETPHDSWNMFDVVLKCLSDWNIENRIFSFTMDNAEVNIKMMRHLRKNLVDRGFIYYEGKLLHVRCAAHVLNLIVQGGLKAMKSVVDNIRESVKYIRSSQARKEQFAKMYVEFRLKTYFGVDAPKHIKQVSTAMGALFTEYAAELGYDVVLSSQERNKEGDVSPDSVFSDWAEHVKLKKTNSRSELQQYLEEDFHPLTADLDILKWWDVNSARYPTLGRIARDVLAVPASTVASESAFSTCGRVITHHRSSLAPETVEALMCLGDWIKQVSSLEASTSHVVS